MFTSLAIAPLAHLGGTFGAGFLPLFIFGHIFWMVALILLVVFLVVGRRRRLERWGHFAGHGSPWGSAASNAESTLAERFAQGDIDEKEYRARLEVLRANNGGGRPAK